MSSAKLDRALFWRRTRQLYADWKKKGKQWGGATPADALLLLRGKADEDVVYSRAASLQFWLFGYELFNTCVAFGDKEILVAANPAKVRALGQLGETDGLGEGETSGVRLTLVEVPKGSDPAEAAERAVRHVKASGAGATCGYIKKEALAGPFADAVMNAVKPKVVLVDVSAYVAVLLQVKSGREIKATRNAADFCTAVLRRHLLREVETIVDEGTKVKHSKLAEKCEDMFQTPKRVKSELQADDLDVAYTPIVQSGGKYDLRASAASDDRTLAHDGVIILSVGARYKQYCANIVRTYFVNPVGKQQQHYKVLQQAFVACRRALRPGRRLQDVYNAAVDTLKSSPFPELAAHLHANCGFGTGMEFRDGTLLISAKGRREIRAGMIFNLAVSLQGLPPNAADGDATYAMSIADTVLVVDDDDDGAEMLTHAKRDWKEVHYVLDDGDESSEASGADEETAAALKAVADAPGGPSARTRGVKRDSLRQHTSFAENKAREDEARRKRKELEKKKQEELKRRLEAKQGSAAPGEKVEDVVANSYKSPLDFPSQASRRLRIFVDQLNETVLLPINGRMVPFHISTIKSVNLTDQHPYKQIRFNFLTPDMPFSQKRKLPPGADPEAMYVKELTYRSKSKNFDQVYFEVNQLRKVAQNLRREREETSTLVEQPNLRLCPRGTKIPRLNDVSVVPAVARGKVAGSVEAHVNGVRFTSRKHGVKLDVLYQNIKHAFIQLARKDTMSVILHFELKHEIMVNKKKTKFVGFYFDVVEASQDLDARVRHGDEDGLVEEQEERRLRSQWNKRFKDFAQDMETMVANNNPEKHHIEFDSPYTELKFEGVANKEVATFTPTVHCLVSLTDNPPVTVTLDDVEIASFERVQFQLRNFDLVLVFKDFSRPPLSIHSIPSKRLDTIKEWLDSVNILHYESRMNMMWKKILETIREDPQQFYENGGWSFLGDEVASDDDDDDDEESEGEEEFAPPSDDSDESEESEEYESDDDSESESDFDDDEESGEDWDELERKAEREDRNKRQREMDRDADDRRPSKRRR